MSRKSDLINTLQEFKKRYETVQLQIAAVRSSNEYTEQGKEQSINRIIAEFSSTVSTYHDNAISQIDKGMEALSDKWRQAGTGRLMDAGYQAGLSNVIKMLEAGAIQSKEDMLNIISTYSGDFNALAMIKNILLKDGSETALDYAGAIPGDNREKNRELLQKLRGNVDQYISAYSINGGEFGANSVSFALLGMIEFCNDRLGDNLELVA